MNQKIGNWPGVTIEKKTGIIKETNFENAKKSVEPKVPRYSTLNYALMKLLKK